MNPDNCNFTVTTDLEFVDDAMGGASKDAPVAASQTVYSGKIVIFGVEYSHLLVKKPERKVMYLTLSPPVTLKTSLTFVGSHVLRILLDGVDHTSRFRVATCDVLVCCNKREGLLEERTGAGLKSDLAPCLAVNWKYAFDQPAVSPLSSARTMM